MAGLTHLFEPEEIIGGVWHRLVSDVGSEPHYPNSAAHLEKFSKRLAIFFRALGGRHGIEIKPIATQTVDYRKKFMATITHGSTLVTRAKFDGDTLFLPEKIDVFEVKTNNENLYKWLTIWAANIGNEKPPHHADPLRNDIAFIRFCHKITTLVLAEFPGIKTLHADLCSAILKARPKRQLPPQEAALETVILALLSGTDAQGDIWQAIHNPGMSLQDLKADKKYKTFLPVALWGEILQVELSTPGRKQTPDMQEAEGEDSGNEKSLKAKRKKSDQIEKESSLLLNRFERQFCRGRK